MQAARSIRTHQPQTFNGRSCDKVCQCASIVRRRNSKCIGFSSNSAKAQTDALVERLYIPWEGTPPPEESPSKSYAEVEYRYCKHKTCSSFRIYHKKDKYKKSLQLREEAQEMEPNCLAPESHFPVGSKLSMIQDECSPTLKKPNEKGQESPTSVALNSSAVGLPILRPFPMEKFDRFLFLVVLSALLVVGINNVIHGLSEVPRPPGRGF